MKPTENYNDLVKQPPKNKLKKIVIVRNAYDWQYGGAEQFSYNLAVSLRNEGVSSIVVTRVPELLAHCVKNDIAVVKNIWLRNQSRRRWMLVYYILYPLLVAQYLWIFARAKADLVVLSSRDDQIFGTIAAKVLGIKTVWFDHADMKHIVAHRMSFLSRSYYWAMRRAGAVIITSQAERDEISKNLPPAQQQNFVVINNGAVRGAGKALKKPVRTKIVAYVGRLERDKGLFDLIEAAVKVSRETSRVDFWLAGKGPAEDELKKRLKELGLNSNFKFLGHLRNVNDLLLAADLFVYPTHHDASPLAPIEALLAGVPVVATQIGGFPEVLPTEAGILVPVHNPDGLADAIIDALTTPGRLKSLRIGTKQAQRLSFATITKDQYLPLFKRLVGGAS